jgi:selenocysteine lyase/cysteine desulfurase
MDYALAWGLETIQTRVTELARHLQERLRNANGGNGGTSTTEFVKVGWPHRVRFEWPHPS